MSIDVRVKAGADALAKGTDASLPWSQRALSQVATQAKRDGINLTIDVPTKDGSKRVVLDEGTLRAIGGGLKKPQDYGIPTTREQLAELLDDVAAAGALKPGANILIPLGAAKELEAGLYKTPEASARSVSVDVSGPSMGSVSMKGGAPAKRTAPKDAADYATRILAPGGHLGEREVVALIVKARSAHCKNPSTANENEIMRALTQTLVDAGAASDVAEEVAAQLVEAWKRSPNMGGKQKIDVTLDPVEFKKADAPPAPKPSADADAAIARAQDLAKTDPKAAARTLASETSAAIAKNDFAAARKMLAALNQEPLRSADVLEIDRTATSGNGVTIKYDGKHEKRIGSAQPADSTVVTLLARQLVFCETAAATLKRPFNPYNLADVRALFQSQSGASTAEIAGLMNRYLASFYVHSGGGVSYPGYPSEQGRGEGQTQTIVDAVPMGAFGRKVVDCEGFSYIANHVLSAVTKDGKPRFETKYISSQAHQTVMFRDVTSDAYVHVNNGDVSVLEDLVLGAEAVETHEPGTRKSSAWAVRIGEKDPSVSPYDKDGLVEGATVALSKNGQVSVRVVDGAMVSAFKKYCEANKDLLERLSWDQRLAAFFDSSDGAAFKPKPLMP